MIKVVVHNQLGNQLFEYAIGRCLSVKQNVPLALHIENYGKWRNGFLFNAIMQTPNYI